MRKAALKQLEIILSCNICIRSQSLCLKVSIVLASETLAPAGGAGGPKARPLTHWAPIAPLQLGRSPEPSFDQSWSLPASQRLLRLCE